MSQQLFGGSQTQTATSQPTQTSQNSFTLGSPQVNKPSGQKPAGAFEGSNKPFGTAGAAGFGQGTGPMTNIFASNFTLPESSLFGTAPKHQFVQPKEGGNTQPQGFAKEGTSAKPPQLGGSKDGGSALPSVFGGQKEGGSTAPPQFGASKEGGGTATSLFGASNQGLSTGLFPVGGPKEGSSAQSSLFGGPKEGANAAPSLFGGQKEGGGTAPSLFSKEGGSGGLPGFGSMTGFGSSNDPQKPSIFGASSTTQPTGFFGQTNESKAPSTSLFGSQPEQKQEPQKSTSQISLDAPGEFQKRAGLLKPEEKADRKAFVESMTVKPKGDSQPPISGTATFGSQAAQTSIPAFEKTVPSFLQTGITQPASAFTSSQDPPKAPNSFEAAGGGALFKSIPALPSSSSQQEESKKEPSSFSSFGQKTGGLPTSIFGASVTSQKAEDKPEAKKLDFGNIQTGNDSKSDMAPKSGSSLNFTSQTQNKSQPSGTLFQQTQENSGQPKAPVSTLFGGDLSSKPQQQKELQGGSGGQAATQDVKKQAEFAPKDPKEEEKKEEQKFPSFAGGSLFKAAAGESTTPGFGSLGASSDSVPKLNLGATQQKTAEEEKKMQTPFQQTQAFSTQQTATTQGTDGSGQQQQPPSITSDQQQQQVQSQTAAAAAAQGRNEHFDRGIQEEQARKQAQVDQETVERLTKRWDWQLEKQSRRYRGYIGEQKQIEFMLMGYLDRIQELEGKGTQVKEMYLENKRNLSNILSEQKVVLDEIRIIDSELDQMLAANGVQHSLQGRPGGYKQTEQVHLMADSISTDLYQLGGLVRNVEKLVDEQAEVHAKEERRQKHSEEVVTMQKSINLMYDALKGLEGQVSQLTYQVEEVDNAIQLIRKY